MCSLLPGKITGRPFIFPTQEAFEFTSKKESILPSPPEQNNPPSKGCQTLRFFPTEWPMDEDENWKRGGKGGRKTIYTLLRWGDEERNEHISNQLKN